MVETMMYVIKFISDRKALHLRNMLERVGRLYALPDPALKFLSRYIGIYM